MLPGSADKANKFNDQPDSNGIAENNIFSINQASRGCLSNKNVKTPNYRSTTMTTPLSKIHTGAWASSTQNWSVQRTTGATSANLLAGM